MIQKKSTSMFVSAMVLGWHTNVGSPKFFTKEEAYAMADMLHRKTGHLYHAKPYYTPKEASNEKEQTTTTTIQYNRTPVRIEGDMPVRPARSARSSARTEPEESKRKVRYMCSLIAAAIVFSLLWLLYY